MLPPPPPPPLPSPPAASDDVDLDRTPPPKPKRRRTMVNPPPLLTRKLLQGKRRVTSSKPVARAPGEVSILRARVNDMARRFSKEMSKEVPRATCEETSRLRESLAIADRRASAFEEQLSSLQQQLKLKDELISELNIKLQGVTSKDEEVASLKRVNAELDEKARQHYANATKFKIEKEALARDFCNFKSGVKHSVVHLPLNKKTLRFTHKPTTQPAMLDQTFAGCVGNEDDTICRHIMVEHIGVIDVARFSLPL